MEKDTEIFTKIAKARVDLIKEVIEYLNEDLGETNSEIYYNNLLVAGDTEEQNNTNQNESNNSSNNQNNVKNQSNNNNTNNTTNNTQQQNNKKINKDTNIGLVDALKQGKISEYTFGGEGLAGGSGTVMIGQFIQNSGSFNIQNAIKWGASHCSSKSLGKCAKYVRLMLEAGGINTAGHPVAAYQYSNFLPSKGFAHIATLNGRAEQSNFTSSSAIAGDVAVMAHGQYGHICMFTGVQWLSDFPQNNMWPYSGNGVVYIFRYAGG